MARDLEQEKMFAEINKKNAEELKEKIDREKKRRDEFGLGPKKCIFCWIDLDNPLNKYCGLKCSMKYNQMKFSLRLFKGDMVELFAVCNRKEKIIIDNVPKE